MNSLEIANSKYIKPIALTKPVRKALCLKNFLGGVSLNRIIVMDFL